MIGRMRLVWITMVALLAACFVKPDPPGVNGNGDAPIGAAPLCFDGTTATLFDDFNGSGSGSAACGDNAGADSTISFVRADGLLTFVPFMNMFEDGYCTWGRVPGHGVIAKWEKLQVADVNDVEGMSSAVVTDSGGSIGATTTLQLVGGGSTFNVQHTGTLMTNDLSYNAAGLWWRIGPSDSATTRVDYSVDGINWSLIATTNDAMSAIDHIEVTIGVHATTADTGQSALDTMYDCP